MNEKRTYYSIICFDFIYIYIVISNNTIKYVLILCKSNIETLCYLPKTVEQTGKDV